jgi:predicted O-methyltransferase YrrM
VTYPSRPRRTRPTSVWGGIRGAADILEVGTLGGYSTLWLARALPPGGRLVTLEAEPRHAEVARANLARAGLSGVVEVRLGRAADTLPRLAAEARGPFDLADFGNWLGHPRWRRAFDP